ncbi:MAG: hypothetical protein NPIRA03_25520 [Nitrospirales bacterium]|nr:MAG: hypothetical protein NPIRA03_25520 [Nitrospirales bacterium]
MSEEQPYTVARKGRMLYDQIPADYIEVERAVYEAAIEFEKTLFAEDKELFNGMEAAKEKAMDFQNDGQKEEAELWWAIARYLENTFYCDGEIRVFEKEKRHHMSNPDGPWW